jgi:CRP-like cAMP-binding protein
MHIALPFLNTILNHLSADDLSRVRPHLERTKLGRRCRLAEPNKPIDAVYFLESGVSSTTASVRHEVPVEVGMVGREGVANLAVLLGAGASPNETFMQIAGSGFRLESSILLREMERSWTLTGWMLRFAHVFLIQTASTVLANGRASINERLARWLLMARDRSDGDDIPLTHEFLAIMLGVRRSGVTVALRELERRGLVALGRGQITLLDRHALEDVANGYYGEAEAEQHRLFPDAT